MAKDSDENLVFVITTARRGTDGIAESDATRNQVEIEIAKWLSVHPQETNLSIRIDEINLMVVADTSALLKHHVNKFG